MSTQVFPSLPGLTFDIERQIQFNNQVMEAVSGKETRIAYWNAARYQWTLTFEFLRASTAFLEFQTLWGFISARQGKFDSFQYTDVLDNTATLQGIGTGDSTNKSFQLTRTFGVTGLSEPLLAPNTITKVTVAGSSISSTQFAVNYWGSSVAGTIVFSTFAPSGGQAVAWSGTYYFPCRFDEDAGTFNNFMSALWENKKVVFRSLK